MNFAALVLSPGGVTAWLAVGLIVGWLAAKMMGDATYGSAGDLLFGALGALIGGVLFEVFVTGEPAFWGAVLGALIGGCLVVGVARAVTAFRSA